MELFSVNKTMMMVLHGFLNIISMAGNFVTKDVWNALLIILQERFVIQLVLCGKHATAAKKACIALSLILFMIKSNADEP